MIVVDGPVPVLSGAAPKCPTLSEDRWSRGDRSRLRRCASLSLFARPPCSVGSVPETPVTGSPLPLRGDFRSCLLPFPSLALEPPAPEAAEVKSMPTSLDPSGAFGGGVPSLLEGRLNEKVTPMMNWMGYDPSLMSNLSSFSFSYSSLPSSSCDALHQSLRQTDAAPEVSFYRAHHEGSHGLFALALAQHSPSPWAALSHAGHCETWLGLHHLFYYSFSSGPSPPSLGWPRQQDACGRAHQTPMPGPVLQHLAILFQLPDLVAQQVGHPQKQEASHFQVRPSH